MFVRNLISPSLIPLKPTDTVEYALGLLLEMRVRHLPVVDSTGKLAGLISEDMLLDAGSPDMRVERLLKAQSITAAPDLHVFEAAKTIVGHGLTALPVVDADGVYLGVVRRHEIFDQLARMLSTQESGAILALEVEPKDHSLSKLVYAIEQNEAHVLSVATEPTGEYGPTRITIKLDTHDTARVRHVLEHNGYNVVAAFSDRDEDDDDLRDRIEEFMRYLEV
jgi:predicted transcriptional regulator